MIGFIKYSLELRKLEKESCRIQKTYATQKKGLSGKELEQLLGEESSIIWPVLEAIDRLKSRRSCQIATKWMVPLPDMQDKKLWQEQSYHRGWILTSKGRWELNKLIRQEKRERWEGVRVRCTSLAKVIGAIAAFIAAMTGLFVVLK